MGVREVEKSFRRAKGHVRVFDPNIKPPGLSLDNGSYVNWPELFHLVAAVCTLGSFSNPCYNSGTYVHGKTS